MIWLIVLAVAAAIYAVTRRGRTLPLDVKPGTGGGPGFRASGGRRMGSTCHRCGALALVEWRHPGTSLPLNFCGHHSDQHAPALLAQGFRVVHRTVLVETKR